MSRSLETISNNIILTNLVKIRWIAILGQFLAILIVFYYLDIAIPILPCLLIVVISAFVNLFSYLTKKINNYLSDKEAFYFLLFDTLQLGILLYLTGGIYNPFSLLLIAPLIISASYLPIAYSIGLSVLSIITVFLISFYSISINWNETFNVPKFFTYGLSISLIVSLIFIAIYVYLFASSARGISHALLQTRSALANQKKLSEVGSLSAAAVHELSTPLNTIFLILDDLLQDKSVNKNNEIKKEIILLKSQAKRCKKILLTLSKDPQNLKDSFLDNTSLSNLIKINFDKFNDKNIILCINLISEGNEPKILFKDELMYGIGNIMQNAIQHTRDRITIDLSWNHNEIKVLIKDNGAGFNKETLDQIGSPYISNNNGMGLGIFIAKNLIENIGGFVFFKNIKDNGASVEIIIKRDS